MHLKNQELITPIVQKPSDPARAHWRRLQSPGPLAAGEAPGTTWRTQEGKIENVDKLLSLCFIDPASSFNEMINL